MFGYDFAYEIACDIDSDTMVDHFRGKCFKLLTFIYWHKRTSKASLKDVPESRTLSEDVARECTTDFCSSAVNSILSTSTLTKLLSQAAALCPNLKSSLLDSYIKV